MSRRWSKFSNEEVERRRLLSVAAQEETERARFDEWYQRFCDSYYWNHGQCCAGCDHWQSSGGESGQCTAAGIMSGADVLRSMGITFSSYTPEPGFPYTKMDDHCGLFRDDFDWSTLDDDYLKAIGAVSPRGMRAKPTKRTKAPT